MRAKTHFLAHPAGSKSIQLDPGGGGGGGARSLEGVSGGESAEWEEGVHRGDRRRDIIGWDEGDREVYWGVRRTDDGETLGECTWF